MVLSQFRPHIKSVSISGTACISAAEAACVLNAAGIVSVRHFWLAVERCKQYFSPSFGLLFIGKPWILTFTWACSARRPCHVSLM